MSDCPCQYQSGPDCAKAIDIIANLTARLAVVGDQERALVDNEHAPGNRAGGEWSGMMTERHICRTCFCLGYDMAPIADEWSCLEHLSGREAADEIFSLRARLAAAEGRTSECVYCHDVLDPTADLDHWETCDKHPARTRLAAAEAANPACEWSTDSRDGEVYETSCGRAWQFIDGNLSENSLKFCPFCGGHVKDVSDFTEEDCDGGAV